MKKTNLIIAVLFAIYGFTSSSASEITEPIAKAATNNRNYVSLIQCYEGAPFVSNNVSCETFQNGGAPTIPPINPPVDGSDIPIDIGPLLSCDALAPSDVVILNDSFGERSSDTWCNSQNIITSEYLTTLPFDAMKNLRNLKFIELETSECKNYADISLAEFNQLSQVESLIWQYTLSSSVVHDLSGMTNLVYLKHVSFMVEGDYQPEFEIFKTSEASDKNKILSLLTLPKYSEGSFNGPTIIVDSQGTFTNEEIIEILANTNVAVDARYPSVPMDATLDQWEMVQNNADDPTEIRYNLTAGNVYYFVKDFTTDAFKPGWYSSDDLITDPNGDEFNNVYSDNEYYEVKNKPSHWSFDNEFRTSVLKPDEDGVYTLTFDDYGSSKFIMIDVTNYTYTNQLSQGLSQGATSNIDITDTGSRMKLLEEIYADSLIYPLASPIYLGELEEGKWFEAGIKGLSSAEVYYKTSYRAGQNYLVSSSSQNLVDILLYKNKDDYLNNVGSSESLNKKGIFPRETTNPEDEGYDNVSKWSGKFEFDFISKENDEDVYVHQSLYRSNFYINPFHFGFFPMPNAYASSENVIEHITELAKGNLSPVINWDIGEPLEEQGVTNEFIHRTFNDNGEINDTLHLDVGEEYLIVAGGKSSISIGVSIGEIIQAEYDYLNIYLDIPYSDWGNSFRTLKVSGSLDPILLQSFNSTSSSDYHYGVFKLDKDFQYTEDNVIKEYISQLYPEGILNFGTPVANNELKKVYVNGFTDLQEIYELKAEKWYSYVIYNHGSTTVRLSGEYFSDGNGMNLQRSFTDRYAYGTLLGRTNSDFSINKFGYTNIKVDKDQKIRKDVLKYGNDWSNYYSVGMFEFDEEPNEADILNKAFYSQYDKLDGSKAITIDNEWKELDLTGGDVEIIIPIEDGYDYAIYTSGENGDVKIKVENDFSQSMGSGYQKSVFTQHENQSENFYYRSLSSTQLFYDEHYKFTLSDTSLTNGKTRYKIIKYLNSEGLTPTDYALDVESLFPLIPVDTSNAKTPEKFSLTSASINFGSLDGNKITEVYHLSSSKEYQVRSWGDGPLTFIVKDATGLPIFASDDNTYDYLNYSPYNGDGRAFYKTIKNYSGYIQVEFKQNYPSSGTFNNVYGVAELNESDYEDKGFEFSHAVSYYNKLSRTATASLGTYEFSSNGVKELNYNVEAGKDYMFFSVHPLGVYPQFIINYAGEYDNYYANSNDEGAFTTAPDGIEKEFYYYKYHAVRNEVVSFTYGDYSPTGGFFKGIEVGYDYDVEDLKTHISNNLPPLD